MKRQRFIDEEIALIISGIVFIIGIGLGIFIQRLLDKII
jgi:hypothetical protein